MLARNNAGQGTARCVASASPEKLARTRILILGILDLNFLGPGCHSQKSTDSSSLELNKIPPPAQGYDRRSLQESWQMEGLGP